MANWGIENNSRSLGPQDDDDSYQELQSSEAEMAESPTLVPIMQRVFVRLVSDDDALKEHLARLRNDGGRYFMSTDPIGNSIEQIWNGHPRSIEIPMFDYYYLLRDGFHLAMVAKLIREKPNAGWAEELDAERPKFVKGDRDDLAAARLYDLAKTLPSELDGTENEAT